MIVTDAGEFIKDESGNGTCTTPDEKTVFLDTDEFAATFFFFSFANSDDQTIWPVPLEVQFTDISEGEPTEWLWDFGDGSGSIEQNASHEYFIENTLDVTLTVSNQSGSDSLIKEDFITVLPEEDDDTNGKSFTFNCENDREESLFPGLKKLTMNVGDTENCTLKLTNHEFGTTINVSTKLRELLGPAVEIEPLEGVTDQNGELEITITALRKGFNWAAWAVPDINGVFEFSKKSYDTGLAWGMFIKVE